MGASSSKHNAPPSPPPSPSPLPSTSSVVKKTSSYTSRVFQSSCLRSHNDDPQVSDNQAKENGSNNKCVKKADSTSNESESEPFNKVKVDPPDTDLDEWGQPNNASSRVLSSRSFNSTTTFISRCSFLPGNMSSRLSRTNNLSSQGSLYTSSRRFTPTNDEVEVHGRSSTSDISINGDERAQTCDFFTACFSNQSPEHIASPQDNNNNNNTSSPSNHTYIEDFDTRRSNGRVAAREPINRNVRFSRTMSVGRLRERSSFLDSAICPFEEDREVGPANTRSEPEENIIISPGPPIQTYVEEIPRTRQARYLDIFEHRSNLIERRRRIRSQARALQRIGSRFEHLSGHERSCILSGRHRTGRCICSASTRENNSNNETTPVSRIVVLAEALFEVLDEIHQRSIVLSSQNSESVGSVPAPNDTVESLPVKLYSRVTKHSKEENDQCYICLLEYEEGDNVRTLPCNHEFHKTCVDKWLKEIHRVCPLCRGDICRPPLLASAD